jgi:opacity protein-like surface antigen
MRKMLLLVGLVLFMGGVAQAQDEGYSKVEISGDYSYMRTNVKVTTQSTGSGIPTSTHTLDSNLNGWSATGAYNVNHWFGLVADLGGEYGTPTITVMSTKFSFQEHLFNAVFGPQINFRNSTKVTPFVHALVGFSHGSFKISSPGFTSKTETDNAFAGAFGGGLDWNVGEHMSIRLIQAEYFPTHFKGNTQNNARISAGIVFRSGDH